MTSPRWTILLFLASILEQQHTFAFVPALQNQRLEPLFMSKNSDRAHLEKNLEDLMDNDWRVFRARLVAQESVEEKEETKKPSPARTEEKHQANKRGGKKLGDLFAGALNSIFSSGNKPHNTTRVKEDDIFNGRSVGGADIPDGIASQDPFVSAEEIPVFLKPKVTIDKHHWAHEIPFVEPGCILVANEKLGGVFHRTVVLIIEHNESNGSVGIVINR